MQIDALMQQGIQSFLRQDFAAALDCFNRILDIDVSQVQALNNRGAVLLQLRRFGESLECFERLLASQPKNVEVLSNCGFALLSLGRGEEALRRLDLALQLAPHHIGTLNNRGLALRDLGRLDEALACFDRALTLQPQYLEAHNNRGLTLLALERGEEALRSFDRALQLAPHYVDAINNCGLALRKLNRQEEALPCFERVLAQQPAHVDALNNRGLVLADLNLHEEALACFERALAVRPFEAGSLVNRGLSLEALQRHDEALACYDTALRLKPNDPAILSNRAVSLLGLDRNEEALHSLEQVLAVSTDQADALRGMGVTLEILNRRREALDCLERSLQLKPGHAEALCNRGFAHLALGHLPQGFRDMEQRWETRHLRGARLKTSAPLWLGEQPLRGRTLLLHHEQGFGDTLQFVRYIPLLAPFGGRLILRLPPPLFELMRSLPGGAQLVSDREPLPAHDFHCPLMSLPLPLGTTLETIPAVVPYLAADAARVAHWRGKLHGDGRPRIGVVWAGRQFKPVNRRRDMRLEILRPLLQLDAQLVSLQKEIPEADQPLIVDFPQLARLGETATDFADTAALIENLDLVVTVDSAVAHLAGALGKPVWIMNRHAACWRWMEQRSDSPWYPTARLFRQPALGDWDGLVLEVVGAMRKWLAQRRSDGTTQPQEEVSRQLSPEIAATLA